VNSPQQSSKGARQRLLPLLLRAAASALVLAALLWFVRSENLLTRLLTMHLGWLALGVACLVGVVVSSSLRWQMLLRGYQVACGFTEALLLYFVALFFTLFLPGSVGSDAARSFYVARRYGRLSAVLLATLQERLAGLGALLVLGLIGTAVLRSVLGGALFATLSLVQLGTLLLVALALAPGPLIALARRLWARAAAWPRLSALVSHRLTQRAARFLAPAAEPLRLSRRQRALLALALVGSSLFGIATYWSLGRALGLSIPWLVLAMASSVVTLARTLPISLNGVGVGEGAFVVMLAPFGVPAADALALSLAGLAAHTFVALVGGLCYAGMLSLGHDLRARAPQEATP
jgi:uncharacterized protein (TIRG00374 family)